MWGFNVTAETYPYDNRPVIPLQDMSFDKWWFVSITSSHSTLFMF